MFFYLLFAAALAMKVRSLRFLVPVLVALSALSLIPHTTWPAIATLLNPILLEFLAGVWLGYAVRDALRWKTSIAVALGGVGALGILFLPAPNYIERPLFWGGSALLLMLSVVNLEERFGRRIPAWMLRIGDASYSLYLVHSLVVLFIARIFLHEHVARPNLAGMAALALVVSVFTALALYRWVERPLTLAVGRWTGWGTPRVVKGIGKEAART